MDVHRALLEGDARAPLRHIERVPYLHRTRLNSVRPLARAVSDHGVERLAYHSGQLRLVIDGREETSCNGGAQNEAIGLVLVAVYRHADVVERSRQDHDHLAILRRQSVIADRGRLDIATD